ncbi:drug/metabolite transporter (DMT)-like permease [Bradyrhizobium yuanmingense]
MKQQRRKAGFLGRNVRTSSHTVRRGRPLSAGAIALMLMLCLTWGFNQIAVKLVLPDIPPMLQATIRSMGALPVLFLIGTFRGVKFFERDGTWKPGLIAGLMFGIEFVLIFQGLHFTSASRAVVFLYTAPFFVALGSYQVLGERLGGAQWLGLAISFAGVALAIGVPQPNVDSQVLLGDLMIVGGAALWAATTLVAKGTRLRFAAPEKALGYQVATSIPILGLAAWLFGESITHTPSPLSLGLMAFQAIWVVGTTFTLWFALVKAYSASKLSAFTFITPLFGVVGSYFIMHDTLSLTFGAAAVLVIAGLFLVNRPSPSAAAPRDALLNVTKT